MMRRSVIMACLLFCLTANAQQKHADTEKLGMALEYFTSGKYHEALLLFQKLDEQYKLNARFRAYIGLCYYYEWDYEKALEYLDATIPLLDALAPHERSVYYYAAAESSFNLQRYDRAIPYYERVLTVCYEREKGDAFYKLGFCYMFDRQWANARDCFASAETFYRRFRDTTGLEARLAQLTNMKKGCEKNMPESDLYQPTDTLSADTTAAGAALTDSLVTSYWHRQSTKASGLSRC